MHHTSGVDSMLTFNVLLSGATCRTTANCKWASRPAVVNCTLTCLLRCMAKMHQRTVVLNCRCDVCVQVMGRLDKLEGSIEHEADKQAHEKQVEMESQLKKALERVTECEGQLEAIQVHPPSVAAASCGACFLLRFALLLPPAHVLFTARRHFSHSCAAGRNCL